MSYMYDFTIRAADNLVSVVHHHRKMRASDPDAIVHGLVTCQNTGLDLLERHERPFPLLLTVTRASGHVVTRIRMEVQL